MIGRDADLARLAAAVGAGGIVTLTGPGGVGKTHLATGFAAIHRDRTGDAVTVARLGPLPAGATAAAVADALGFASLDAAAVALARRGGLVVLDDCGHVRDAAREVATVLVGEVACVLVTSREPLGAAPERVVVVGPLALAAPGGADAEASPAVVLFLERAAAAGAVLDATPDVLAAVAELCRRLDGLPLAIELAAGRVRGTGVAALLADLDHRLDLLRRSRSARDGHDSMRAAIDASLALLEPAERATFRRVGVFSGPFDVDVAHAVAGEPAGDRRRTLEVLAGLVERSLVGVDAASGPTTQYVLLELLREHAVAELAAAGERDAIEERFVTAMVATADDIVAAALSRWDPEVLASASGQHRNLARACELCLQRDERPDRAHRLLLPMFASVHEGRPDEVWELGARVRERWGDGPAPWRAELLAVLASAAAIAGRPDDAIATAQLVVDDAGASSVALALADRAWGLAARAADPVDAARHFELARIAAERTGFASMALEVAACRAGELDLAGDTDGALVVLTDVLATADVDDDVVVRVFAHLVACHIHLRGGDVDEAGAELDLAARSSATLGRPWWTAAIMRARGCVAALGPGGWPASASTWRDAIDGAGAGGELGEVAITLRTAASVAHHLGEHGPAEVLWAAVPRVGAITVLPELFPVSMHALVASGTTAPSGTNLVAALRRARAALAPDDVEAPPPVPDDDVHAELVLEGDSWRIGFAGRTVRVRDVKGIGDLAVLLGRPGREVHALELMGGADVGGANGPVVDHVARAAYQARIVELQREIDASRDDHDAGRAERAEAELDALVDQLREAFGLGGRSRATGSAAERARTAVTYRVRAAIRRVADVHPSLGRHLTNAVRTGTWCSYRPESEVTWRIEQQRLTV